MTKEKLIALLRNPDQTGQAVDELDRLIEEYPYFHIGYQLYLKGLRQTDEKKMVSQLKKTALCVRDRDVLYHYINRGCHYYRSKQCRCVSIVHCFDSQTTDPRPCKHLLNNNGTGNSM